MRALWPCWALEPARRRGPHLCCTQSTLCPSHQPLCTLHRAAGKGSCWPGCNAAATDALPACKGHRSSLLLLFLRLPLRLVQAGNAKCSIATSGSEWHGAILAQFCRIRCGFGRWVGRNCVRQASAPVSKHLQGSFCGLSASAHTHPDLEPGWPDTTAAACFQQQQQTCPSLLLPNK